jgi:DNA sulfur modification protein DndB
MAIPSSFPAIKGRMGEKGSEITYYLLKMPVHDLVRDVRISTEIANDNKGLQNELQRTLKKSRSRKEISRYLAEAHKFGERFMGSFVIASWGGEPKFVNLKPDLDDDVMEFMHNSGYFNDVGVLQINKDAEYFVLDGQHRLAGIRSLLNFYEDDPSEYDAPPGLVNDEMSIVLITDEGLDEKEKNDEESYKKRLRRIFTVLNRHAKKTTLTENIIMDEDDIAAVHTRRLVNELQIFAWSGENDENPTVLTTKDNLSENDHHLTTLSTIYSMNKYFLMKIYDEDEKYFNFSRGHEETEERYKAIKLIWEVMVENIPEWTSADRGKMKNHTEPDDRGEDGSMDHLLFWPVGQKGLASYLASQISIGIGNGRELDKKLVKQAMKGLNKIEWDLFHGPWRGLILRQHTSKNMALVPGTQKEEPEVSWKIFGSAAAEVLVDDMLMFLTGKMFLDDKSVENWKKVWVGKIQLYKATEKDLENIWSQTMKVRKAASS